MLLLAQLSCASEKPSEAADGGIPQERLLSQLLDEEHHAMCDSLQRYADDRLPASLYARAACVQLAKKLYFGESCERAVRACGADNTASRYGLVELPSYLYPFEPNCFSPAEFAGCHATVGAFERCIRDAIDTQRELLDAQQCELSGPPSRYLASCVDLQWECPALTPLLLDAMPHDVGGLCDQQQFEFDGQDCKANDECPAISCSCGLSAPAEIAVCNATLGCLSSASCDGICQGELGSALCAERTACGSDADCGGYPCVADDIGVGQCRRGDNRDPCREANDCPRSKCVLGFCEGASLVGTPCKDPVECVSGFCVPSQGSLDSPGDFRFVTDGSGKCSDGAPGDACRDRDDCGAHHCARHECRSGETGSLCDSEEDCEEGYSCLYGVHGGSCENGSIGSRCEFDSDCRSDRRCEDELCARGPHDSCDVGMPDCHYQCQLQQEDCEGSSCNAMCLASDCEGATLATWSADDIIAGVQVSDDGLTVSGTRTAGGVRADMPLVSGRYYWEVSADAIPAGGYAVVGVAPASWPLGSMLGDQSGQGIGFESTSNVLIDGVVSTLGCGFGADDVIGVAVDLDAMRMYLSINGLWQAGASPDQGEGGIDISVLANAEIFPAAGVSRDASVRANFGQTPFAHRPPSGFEPVFQR